MNQMEWIAPCHFGLESVVKREVQDLGYEVTQVEDGRVTFSGGTDASCRANIFLRSIPGARLSSWLPCFWEFPGSCRRDSKGYVKISKNVKNPRASGISSRLSSD